MVLIIVIFWQISLVGLAHCITILRKVEYLEGGQKKKVQRNDFALYRVCLYLYFRSW